MRVTLIVFVICLLLGLAILGNFTWTDPDEYTFSYNLLQGKPINRTNNPLLKNGPHVEIGFNDVYFSVTRNSLHQDFANDRLKKIMEMKRFHTAEEAVKYKPSPEELSALKDFYDTAPCFNSLEGARMSISTSISGSVSNPWLFFKHFGDTQYDYHVEGRISSQKMVYEALYQSNQFLDVQLTEIAQDVEARQIQIRQDEIKDELLKRVTAYMEQFGFKIDNLMFTDRFVYLDGSEILQARSELGNVNSEIRQKETELEQAKETEKQKIDAAKRQADRRVSEAKREAEKQTKEAEALANQLKASIDQIGVDATVDLFQTRLVAPLLKEGKVRELYLDEDSFIGRAIK